MLFGGSVRLVEGAGSLLLSSLVCLVGLDWFRFVFLFTLICLVLLKKSIALPDVLGRAKSLSTRFSADFVVERLSFRRVYSTAN